MSRSIKVEAQGQVDSILTHLEYRTLDGAEDRFRVLLTCYEVLYANEDGRAGGVLSDAYDLLQSLALDISDDKLRQSFLERVPSHREIVRLWDQSSLDRL